MKQLLFIFIFLFSIVSLSIGQTDENQKLTLDLNFDGKPDIVSIEREAIVSAKGIWNGDIHLKLKCAYIDSDGKKCEEQSLAFVEEDMKWKLDKKGHQFSLSSSDVGAGRANMSIYIFGYDKKTKSIRLNAIRYETHSLNAITGMTTYDLENDKYSYTSYHYPDGLDGSVKTDKDRVVEERQDLEKANQFIIKNTIPLSRFNPNNYDNGLDTRFNATTLQDLEKLRIGLEENELEDYYKKYLRLKMQSDLRSQLLGTNYSDIIIEDVVDAILRSSPAIYGEDASDADKKTYIKALDKLLFNKGFFSPKNKDVDLNLNLNYYSKKDNSIDYNFSVTENAPGKLLRVVFTTIERPYAYFFDIEKGSLSYSPNYMKLYGIPPISHFKSDKKYKNLSNYYWYEPEQFRIEKTKTADGYTLMVPYWTPEDSMGSPSILGVYTTRDFKTYQLKKIETIADTTDLKMWRSRQK